MSEVHRYKVAKMLSQVGNRISYDPHGPEVVMASAYDQLKAENDTLLLSRDRAARLLDKFEAQHAELKVALASIEKDAERYRWLRDEEYLHNWAQVHVCDESRRAEITDKAIDAAMAKEATR